MSMDINIITATRAIINNFNDKEIQSLKDQFTYINSSIAYQIKKHKEARWWKRRNPSGWNDKLLYLQSKLSRCLIEKENESFYIRPGLIPYIKGIQYKQYNGIEYPNFKEIKWKRPLEFRPYSYQTESVKKLLKQKHGNIDLPTGAGKSLVLLMLAQQTGLSTAIVTPSKSIFNELLKTFQYHLGKEYVGGYGDGKKDIGKSVTVCIGKSLTMLKPNTKEYNFFKNIQVLEVDESHSFASEQLEKVCHGVFKSVPYRFFVSATQTRNDGTEKVLQSIIGKNVLNMTIKRAINEKYLCPLRFNILTIHSPDNRTIKDAMQCKRVHFLYNFELAKLIANITNANWRIKQQSTLILVEELTQIQLLVPLITAPMGYVHASPKREAAVFGLNKVKLQDEVDKFNKGETRVLIGTRAISTGTNLYPTHNTINWMGGGSEIVTKQGAMGRSTRKLEKSKYKQFHNPKPFCTIYDFKLKNVPMLNRQLFKRIKFYNKTGGMVNFF